MNCEDMTKIPELNHVLNLKAGADGMKHAIRWIYFADCLQCVKSEYKVEEYIHGGEFVVLTNRSVTDDKKKLMTLIGKMEKYGISALGINEGQISEELIKYCESKNLPLFELPEKFPLVDLSQILCHRLVLEENNKNIEEQVFSSILDAEHLNRDSVLAQARYLNIDLSGKFCVVEFAFAMDTNDNGDFLTMGQDLRRIISMEFSFYIKDVLLLLQTGSVLALVSTERISEDNLKEILRRIVNTAWKRHHMLVDIGIGNAVQYLEDVKESRREASVAIKVAEITKGDEHIFFYKEQGIYTMISKIQDSRFLDEFIDKHIGRLIRADEINNGSLCKTLESYLNHNCNAKETAEALFIHRNTLNYRMHKIRGILGHDFEDLDSCLMLKLAFMISSYRNRRIG